MEHTPSTQQTLDALKSRAGDSPILTVVTPLFETTNYHDEYRPKRITENNGDAQLLWETGEWQSPHFERLCLTLSRRMLSLTIALDHHHLSKSDIPQVGQEQPLRSTMVINQDTHMLFESHRYNGVSLARLYNENAVERFTPKLTHNLAVIGLYGYGQDVQREVS